MYSVGSKRCFARNVYAPEIQMIAEIVLVDWNWVSQHIFDHLLDCCLIRQEAASTPHSQTQCLHADRYFRRFVRSNLAMDFVPLRLNQNQRSPKCGGERFREFSPPGSRTLATTSARLFIGSNSKMNENPSHQILSHHLKGRDRLLCLRKSQFIALSTSTP